MGNIILSGTLRAYSSYRIDAHPWGPTFYLGYFGVSQKAACPLNINHSSVLVISTGVTFCDIEPLCVTRMCWVPMSSLGNYRMGCLIVGVRRVWDLPQNLTTILLLREYHSLSTSLGSPPDGASLAQCQRPRQPSLPSTPHHTPGTHTLPHPHVIPGHSKVDFPWIWFT